MSAEQQNVGSVTETFNTETKDRVIKIVPTRGEHKEIVFNDNSWADLKPILEQNGYNLNNMKAVESVNKNTLEHPKAILPDGDFKLFLIPLKSKSGSERTDVVATIRGFIEADGDKAKAHFNEGKNYTNKSTGELQTLIESYAPGTAKKASTQKAKAIAEVVGAVKDSKEDNDLYIQLQGLSTDEKLDIVISLLMDMRANGTHNIPQSEAAVEVAEIEEDRQKKEEERQRKQEEEEDMELRDLAYGFDDIDL